MIICSGNSQMYNDEHHHQLTPFISKKQTCFVRISRLRFSCFLSRPKSARSKNFSHFFIFSNDVRRFKNSKAISVRKLVECTIRGPVRILLNLQIRHDPTMSGSINQLARHFRANTKRRADTISWSCVHIRWENRFNLAQVFLTDFPISRWCSAYNDCNVLLAESTKQNWRWQWRGNYCRQTQPFLPPASYTTLNHHYCLVTELLMSNNYRWRKKTLNDSINWKNERWERGWMVLNKRL